MSHTLRKTYWLARKAKSYAQYLPSIHGIGPMVFDTDPTGILLPGYKAVEVVIIQAKEFRSRKSARKILKKKLLRKRK